jgi:hypothetical protein
MRYGLRLTFAATTDTSAATCMALLGIVNIASSLPIHARFDVVAVKIYEERTVVAAPA